MISIFKGMAPVAASPGNPTALPQVVETLKASLIRAKGLNYEELIAALDELVEIAKSPASPTTLASAEDKVRLALELYFEQLGKSIDSVGFDLATSIRALATLLHGNSQGQDQFLNKMEDIRDNFQAGHTLDDIHQLRQHLDSCLTSLRSELVDARVRQQEHNAAILDQMSSLHRTITSLRSSAPKKPISGPALAIIGIRRLKVVSARYGIDIAQKLMEYVVQLLLVRWPAAYDITPYGDECLVVMDSHNLDLEFHRNALRKLSTEKLTFSTLKNGRPISLPLALEWTVLRAPEDRDVEEFIQSFLQGMAQKENQAAALDKVLAIQS